MNTKTPAPSDPGNPEAVADAIIEDLNKDEVLPPDESDVIPDTEEPEEMETSEVVSWSGLGADLGHRVGTSPLEDEVAAAQDLVNAGLDEADDELRELDEVETDETEDSR